VEIQPKDETEDNALDVIANCLMKLVRQPIMLGVALEDKA